jgi:hypothetical protein
METVALEVFDYGPVTYEESLKGILGYPNVVILYMSNTDLDFPIMELERVDWVAVLLTCAF